MAKINMEDLRIVKLYGVYKVVKNNVGDVENIETVKMVPYFVLVKKYGRNYRVVPTSKLEITKTVKEFSDTQYDIIINKMRKNNRYRKPHSLCPALGGKSLTIEQTTAFAERIQQINSNLSEEVTEKLLKYACEEFAQDLQNSNNYNSNNSLVY